ncbi:MAG: CIA30 family protein [bacterium]|nr:CIA30 family protein [bacterium]
MTTQTLFDFSDRDVIRGWGSVDDVVMGGVSRGSIVPTETGTALFSGVVRLENNGGFSSVRADFRPIDLSRFDGIALRVRGDGKRYGLYLQDQMNRIASPLYYQSNFDTQPGVWQDVVLPFRTFGARWWGQRIPAPPLNVRGVNSMNVIIEEKQKGSFALEIASISAYRSGMI